MHVVLGGVTVFLMFLAIGFGAAAFGKRFRLYSIASIVVLLVFGGLTFLEAPRLEANLPTPWIGLWERINISVFLLWVVVLAPCCGGPEHRTQDATCLAHLRSRFLRVNRSTRWEVRHETIALGGACCWSGDPRIWLSPPLPTRYERCSRTPGRSGPPRHLDAMGCGRVRGARLRRSGARGPRDFPPLRRRSPFRP